MENLMPLLYLILRAATLFSTLAATQKSYCNYIKHSFTLQCSHHMIQRLEKNKEPFDVLGRKYDQININYADLQYLNHDAFEDKTDLIILDLSHNLIETLDNRLFLKLTKLISIYLSDNRLKNLYDGIFVNQVELIRLNLTMNKLMSIDPAILEPLVNLKDFYLSGNPFYCDCKLWLTLQWCKEKQLFNLSTVRCAKPNNITWLTWSSELSTHDCPAFPLTQPSDILLTVAIVFLTVCFIVCLLLAGVLYYCRRKNKVNAARVPEPKRRSGQDNLHSDMPNSVSYLSVIPEITECSSRAESCVRLAVANEFELQVMPTRHSFENPMFVEPGSKRLSTFKSNLDSGEGVIYSELNFASKDPSVTTNLNNGVSPNVSAAEGLTVLNPVYSDPIFRKISIPEISYDAQDLSDSRISIDNPLYSEPDIRNDPGNVKMAVSEENPFYACSEKYAKTNPSVIVESVEYAELLPQVAQTTEVLATQQNSVQLESALITKNPVQ